MKGFPSYFTCAALTNCKGELSLLLNLLRRGVCHHHCSTLVWYLSAQVHHSHFNRWQIWDRMSNLLCYTVKYILSQKNLPTSVSYHQYLERLNQAYPVFELICWINLCSQCGTLWKEVIAGQHRLEALPDAFWKGLTQKSWVISLL